MRVFPCINIINIQSTIAEGQCITLHTQHLPSVYGALSSPVTGTSHSTSLENPSFNPGLSCQTLGKFVHSAVYIATIHSAV